MNISIEQLPKKKIIIKRNKPENVSTIDSQTQKDLESIIETLANKKTISEPEVIQTNVAVKDVVKLKVRAIKKDNKNKASEIKIPKFETSNSILTYDSSIKDQYKKDIIINDNKINYDIISKLPSLKLKNIVIENDEVDEVEQEINITQEEDAEVDTDNLEMDEISNKKYYFDYNKGIIYNLSLKPIGFIDEYGELNFEDE